MKENAISKLNKRCQELLNDCTTKLGDSSEKQNIVEALSRASKELHKLAINDITKTDKDGNSK